LWWISVPGCGHPASTSRMWAVPTTQSLYVQQSASTEKTRSGLATNRVVSAMTWGFSLPGVRNLRERMVGAATLR
jgi:hypothetical protein